jgi:hypothetical protein
MGTPKLSESARPSLEERLRKLEEERVPRLERELADSGSAVRQTNPRFR